MAKAILQWPIMEFDQRDKELLHEAMKEITAMEREALILRHWHYKTIEQVAKALGVSWGDANALIESGQAALKRILLESTEFNHKRGERWKK